MRLAAAIQRELIDPLRLLLSQAAVYEQSFAGQAGARTAMGVMAALARQVLQRACDLEADLYPAALSSLGLEAALEMLVGRILRASGVTIELKCRIVAPRLPPTLELALFRVAQAAIERAIAAHAHHLLVRLESQPEQLTLRLCDDSDPEVRSELLVLPLQRASDLGGIVRQGRSSSGGLDLIVTVRLLPLVLLTTREQEVFTLLTEGLTTRAIALRLGLSARTVSFHLDNIYGKLGVHSRSEAIIAALRMGENRQ
jgi:DNA-binding CsgD family transcriptional regulator